VSRLDWGVLIASMLFIVLYGWWKSRHNRSLNDYFLGNKKIPWYAIGISVMATQASAITFLSVPGQAYADGMRFVQFYFGLPLAIVVICMLMMPVYHRLKVLTPYEYLENRFDKKTRSLTAFLFLIQRGLSTGISIYAPAIVLSSILGWNIYLTNLCVGLLVIFYTVIGGTRAVTHTQLGQMTIILAGICIAGVMIVHLLPPQVSFTDAIHLAGKAGRLNTIDFKLDFTNKNKYNIWSGIIGGFFLQLSYFGTDHSQVGRYLSGQSVRNSRLGLLMNAILKIPMQFGILFIGVMMFTFYLFYQPPLLFNRAEKSRLQSSKYAADYNKLETHYNENFREKTANADKLLKAIHSGNETEASRAQAQLVSSGQKEKLMRDESRAMLNKADPFSEKDDTNYVFINFVVKYLPEGLVGLLIAVILAAAMSSCASALNSLASTTVVDVIKSHVPKERTDRQEVRSSRWMTLAWGLYSIAVAEFANRLGSLIEAVNVLGSLFYGTILGIFLIAFLLKSIRGTATFYAALLAEACVMACYALTDTAFLWFNVLGAALTIAFALSLNILMPERERAKA
jgi:Na+/proline symporter